MEIELIRLGKNGCASVNKWDGHSSDDAPEGCLWVDDGERL